MATVTLPPLAAHRPFSPTPYISSPLTSSDQRVASSTQRTPSRRHTAFPSSRPLRPFPSISHTSGKKPIKFIEPPQNHDGTFVLNLTQAELSRKD